MTAIADDGNRQEKASWNYRRQNVSRGARGILNVLDMIIFSGDSGALSGTLNNDQSPMRGGPWPLPRALKATDAESS